jgi:TP901 family phage tail tape measure protein
MVELEVDPSGLNRMGKSIDRALTKSGKLRNFGKSMTRNVSAPLAAVGGLATKAFSDFDSALQQSISIMDDTAQSMRGEMASAAREVSQATTTSSRDAAKSFYYLASAGLDAKESIASLPDVAKFAQAGMFDMKRATDLATDAQSALGLKVEDTQKNAENMRKVMDNLVRANQLANASVEQFSEALTNRAAAGLKVANKSIEEGVAVLAAFADQGTKGRRAGMRLSQILRILSKSASENTERFRELGLVDTEGNLKSMSTIIRSLTDELGGLSDAALSAELDQLGFTARVQQAIKPLLGQADAIENYRKELEEAGGAVDEVAQKQLKSLQAQFKLTFNAITNAAQELGAAMAPAVRPVLDAVRDVVQAFRELPDSVKRTIAIVGGLVAAVGPLLVVIGAIAPAITSAIGVFGSLASAGGTLAGVLSGLASGSMKPLFLALRPILPLLKGMAGVLSGPFAAAAGVAAAAGSFIYARWDDLRAALAGPIIRVWEALSETVGSVMSSIGDSVGDVLGEIQKIWEGVFGDAVVAAVGVMADVIATVAVPAIESIGRVVEHTVRTVKNHLGLIISVLRGDFTGALDYIEAEWKRSFEFMKESVVELTDASERELTDFEKAAYVVFSDIRDVVKGWANDVVYEARWAWARFRTEVKDAWPKIEARIEEGAAKAWKAFKKGFFDLLPDALEDALKAVRDWAASVGKAVRDGVSGAVSDMKAEVDRLAGEYNIRFNTEATGSAARILTGESLGGDPVRSLMVKVGGSAGAEKVEDTKKEMTELQKTINETMGNLRSSLDEIGRKTEFWNTPLEGAKNRVRTIKRTIDKLLTEGMNPSGAAAARLRDRLSEARDKVRELLIKMRDIPKAASADLDLKGLIPESIEVPDTVFTSFQKLADKLGTTKRKVEELPPAFRQSMTRVAIHSQEYAQAATEAFFKIKKQVQKLGKDLLKSFALDTGKAIGRGVARMFGAMTEQQARLKQKIKSTQKELSAALEEGASAQVERLRSRLGRLRDEFEKSKFGLVDIGKGLIKTLVDALGKIGEILIGAGSAIASLGGPGGLVGAILSNPLTAIAAGVALTALSAGLGMAAKSPPEPVGSGGGGTASFSGNPGGGYRNGSMNSVSQKLTYMKREQEKTNERLARNQEQTNQRLDNVESATREGRAVREGESRQVLRRARAEQAANDASTSDKI